MILSMRTILFICIVEAMICSSCQPVQPEGTGTSFSLNDTVVIGYHQTLSNRDENISVTFDSVLDDSRCATGAECLWAGTADVKLTFLKNNVSAPCTLGLYQLALLAGPRDTVLGYQLELISLSPEQQLNRTILPDEYSARIVVSK
jgi:hypothetical protein